jgi:nicotinamide-nucleotide amidase
VSFDRVLLDQAEALLAACRAKGIKLAAAESCTGGLILGCLTEIAGSSEVVDRGFVVYSNQAKIDLLDVPADLLARHGAVSEDVARAMVAGALKYSQVNLAIACTGIAGPSGGSKAKPIGRVHIAAGLRGGSIAHIARDYGDIGRDAVRNETVRDALALASSLIV